MGSILLDDFIDFHKLFDDLLSLMVTDKTGNLFTLYIFYKYPDSGKYQIKYQKFIPLPSERFSRGGDVKASAPSEHKSGSSRGSKMSCA